MNQNELSTLLAAAALAGCVLWTAAGGARPATGLDSGAAQARARGTGAAYREHCAVCHGTRGDGDGPAANFLAPRPRDFTQGRFQLVSTENGVPTDEDLMATIRRGIPGSTMPGWAWLPQEELEEIVAFVRRLAVEGQAERKVEAARDEGRELSWEAALADVRASWTPTAVVDPGPPLPVDDELLARGRTLYAQRCAACHGADGRGSGSGPFVRPDGSIARARDFTGGLLKGGVSETELAWRILAGMPGTPMVATEFAAAADARAVAAYLRSLIDTEAWERALPAQRTIPVRKVEGPLPAEPDDPAWEQAPSVWIPLLTLWWRPDRIAGVEVRGLHDGSHVALRFTWEDETRDDRLLGSSSLADGFALMLAEDMEAPLFAMGEAGHPVRIWHWKAAWLRGLAGALDASETPVPHRGKLDAEQRPAGPDTRYRVEGWKPAEGGDAEAIEARTFGRVRFGDAGEEHFMKGWWRDGRWALVARRPFSKADDEQILLLPDAAVPIAIAVWDGSAGDAGPRKAATSWHRLAIE